MNSILGDKYEVFSAGTEPRGINEFAIEAMSESGIDISGQYSKSTDEFTDINFDYVVTVCDSTNENCPLYLEGQNLIHKGFDDPSVFDGDDGQKLQVFRRVRDEIREWIKSNF